MTRTTIDLDTMNTAATAVETALADQHKLFWHHVTPEQIHIALIAAWPHIEQHVRDTLAERIDAAEIEDDETENDLFMSSRDTYVHETAWSLGMDYAHAIVTGKA